MAPTTATAAPVNEGQPSGEQKAPLASGRPRRSPKPSERAQQNQEQEVERKKRTLERAESESQTPKRRLQEKAKPSDNTLVARETFREGLKVRSPTPKGTKAPKRGSPKKGNGSGTAPSKRTNAPPNRKKQKKDAAEPAKQEDSSSSSDSSSEDDGTENEGEEEEDFISFEQLKHANPPIIFQFNLQLGTGKPKFWHTNLLLTDQSKISQDARAKQFDLGIRYNDGDFSGRILLALEACILTHTSGQRSLFDFHSGAKIYHRGNYLDTDYFSQFDEKTMTCRAPQPISCKEDWQRAVHESAFVKKTEDDAIVSLHLNLLCRTMETKKIPAANLKPPRVGAMKKLAQALANCGSPKTGRPTNLNPVSAAAPAQANTPNRKKPPSAKKNAPSPQTSIHKNKPTATTTARPKASANPAAPITTKEEPALFVIRFQRPDSEARSIDVSVRTDDDQTTLQTLYDRKDVRQHIRTNFPRDVFEGVKAGSKELVLKHRNSKDPSTLYQQIPVCALADVSMQTLFGSIPRTNTGPIEGAAFPLLLLLETRETLKNDSNSGRDL